jgi:hypothetical protein
MSKDSWWSKNTQLHTYKPCQRILDLWLVIALGMTGKERRAIYTQLDQQDKAWALKAQQD